MSWSTLLAVGLGLVACFARTDAALRVANYYGSGMVLQRGPAQANIVGTGGPAGGTVELTVDGEAAGSGSVGSDGSWSAKLSAMDAGGPYTIGISSSEGDVSLDDVYFGDVWICSGQSNMEFPFQQVDDFSALRNKAVTFENIRFLRIKRATSGNVQSEPNIETSWQKPAKDSATNGFSGLCILYAVELSPKIDGAPIGLVDTSWGGTPVESWMSPAALSACPGSNFDYGSNAEVNKYQLWNAMVAPITPMTIFGAIWYQGESNSEHAADYKCTFDAMIDNWRVEFNKASGETSADFPFGFVQLAPWRDERLPAGWVDIRWSQTYGYGYVPNPDMPNVFMGSAMDLPDFDSPYSGIHPRFKQDIAERLVLAARAVAYGEDVDFQGPFPQSYSVSGSSMTISYGSDASLDVRSSSGFEVCCASTSSGSCSTYSFTAVRISSSDATSVTLDTSACGNQVVATVRYAWEETPCAFKQCAIYSQSNDLPGTCFTKDGPY